MKNTKAIANSETSAQDEQMSDNQTAIELLRSWRQGDEAEQRETLKFLQEALNEDRLSDRPLFK